jgi:hypothetical protein
MICLESRIIEHIREIILKEDFVDLRKGDTLHEFFAAKAEMFSFFKRFKMHEFTKKYIEYFEEVIKELKKPDFTEEGLEEIRKKFKNQEEHWDYCYRHSPSGRGFEVNKHGKIFVQDRYEQLSFSLYEFAKKEYDNLESRTEEEKKELLKNLSLINGYLRNYSFAVAADAVSALISACLNGKEPWKNMYREE